MGDYLAMLGYGLLMVLFCLFIVLLIASFMAALATPIILIIWAIVVLL